MASISNEQIKTLYTLCKTHVLSKSDLKISFIFERKDKIRLANILNEDYQMNDASAQMYINCFEHMCNGELYTRTINTFGADYFLLNIGNDFGEDIKRKALVSFAKHIHYLEDKQNTNLISYRKVLLKHSVILDDNISVNSRYEIDFANEVESSLKLNIEKRHELSEEYPELPAQFEVRAKQFIRNPHVVAEALSNASGVCDECTRVGPFIGKSKNTPFLEVHHRIPLSEGGKDTIKNAIALCPNCHREAHFGVDWEKFRN